MDSAVASQQYCLVWIPVWPRAFYLWRTYALSLCSCGFSLGIPVSSHSPKACMLGPIEGSTMPLGVSVRISGLCAQQWLPSPYTVCTGTPMGVSDGWMDGWMGYHPKQWPVHILYPPTERKVNNKLDSWCLSHLQGPHSLKRAGWQIPCVCYFTSW